MLCEPSELSLKVKLRGGGNYHGFAVIEFLVIASFKAVFYTKTHFMMIETDLTSGFLNHVL